MNQYPLTRRGRLLRTGGLLAAAGVLVTGGIREMTRPIHDTYGDLDMSQMAHCALLSTATDSDAVTAFVAIENAQMDLSSGGTSSPLEVTFRQYDSASEVSVRPQVIPESLEPGMTTYAATLTIGGLRHIGIDTKGTVEVDALVDGQAIGCGGFNVWDGQNGLRAQPGQ